MIVRQREIAQGKGDKRIRHRGRRKEGGVRKGEGKKQQRERERQRVQQRCHLNAADVIPKISNNNSRR